MAEKFICVRKYDSPCEKCEVKKICGRDCVFKEMFEKDPYKITRQEAIEKMAKAMIKRYNSERTLTKWEKEWDKKHPKEAYKYFYIDAEKALNALLEGK